MTLLHKVEQMRRLKGQKAIVKKYLRDNAGTADKHTERDTMCVGSCSKTLESPQWNNEWFLFGQLAPC